MARRDRRTGCVPRACQLLSRHCIFMSGRLYGNYLTCCYVVVKLCYCFNAVAQLFLLDLFLGYDYHVLGLQVIRHLLIGDEWIPSQRRASVFSINFELFGNFYFHKICIKNGAKLKQKTLVLRNLGAKLRFCLRALDLLCRKFAAVCREILSEI